MNNRNNSESSSKTVELLSPEALLYYHDNPVDFIEDWFMAPARVLKPGVCLSKQQKNFMNAVARNNFVSVESGHGSGKLQPVDTMIETPSGLRMFGDLRPGDFVFARNGKPTRVKEIHPQGIQPVYRVTFDDYSSTEVGLDHLWTVKGRSERRYKKDWKVLSTKEIINKGLWRKNGINKAREFVLPMHGPACFNKQDVVFDPYAIGIWLGDGSCDTGVYTKNDTEIAERIRSSGVEVLSRKHKDKATTWRVIGLTDAIKKLGLFKISTQKKFVPMCYKYNSEDVRHAVLQGLIDTDGYVDKHGSVVFSSTSKQLAEDVAWLSRSLGGKAYTSLTPQKSGYKKDGVYHQCCDCYEVFIRMPKEYPAAYIPRKASLIRDEYRESINHKWFDSIEYTRDVECMCITVEDEEHIYLTNDFIPTHNSSTYSFLTYWFLFTRDNPVDITKIRLCANSYNQLYDILWPELRRWISFSPLKQLVTVEARSIFIPKFNKDGTINKEHTFVTPVSPSNPDNLQGAHAAHLMWLVDEAFGIQDNLVWETIEGSTTEEDNKLIIAGQHTTLSGYVHDTFHKNKAMWFNLRLSSIDSPFVKKEYIDRLKKKYGEDSDVYRIRVLGMEPSGRSDAFISYDRVQAAVERDISANGDVEFGLDIARFGDDMTVLTMRHGMKVYPQRTFSRLDSFAVVKEVISAVKDIRRWTKFQGTIKIKIDATGGHGSGVIDILGKDRDHNIEIVPIVYSGGGGDDVYANITSRMWGEIRDNIDSMSLPNDEFLIEELTSRTYRYDERAKIRIQDKQSYKQQHDGLSPDRSDSLCLCFTGIRAIDRVFNNYVSTNRSCHGKLDIPWDKILPSKFQVYIVMKMMANTVYGSFYLYNMVDDRLFQYDEFVKDTPTPESIIMEIKTRSNVPMQSNSSVCINDIYSDSLAFAGGKDMSYKLLKSGLRVKEAYDYDRQGAILHLNALLAVGKVKIEEKCEKTDKQFSEWSLHSNGSPERGYCLCENMLMITSVIRKKKAERIKESPRSGYSANAQSTKKRFEHKANKKSGKSGWEYLAN